MPQKRPSASPGRRLSGKGKKRDENTSKMGDVIGRPGGLKKKRKLGKAKRDSGERAGKCKGDSSGVLGVGK